MTRLTVDNGFQTSHKARPLYALLKTDKPNTINQKKGDGLAFEALNKSVPTAPDLRPPNDQLPFFLCVTGKECPWCAHPKTQGPPSPHKVLESIGRCYGWGIPACLRAIPATALWDKATEEFITPSPLTIAAPHVVEALLNSPHTQHFPDSHLTSYEILLVPLLT